MLTVLHVSKPPSANVGNAHTAMLRFGGPSVFIHRDSEKTRVGLTGFLKIKTVFSTSH